MYYLSEILSAYVYKYTKCLFLTTIHFCKYWYVFVMCTSAYLLKFFLVNLFIIYVYLDNCSYNWKLTLYILESSCRYLSVYIVFCTSKYAMFCIHVLSANYGCTLTRDHHYLLPEVHGCYRDQHQLHVSSCIDRIIAFLHWTLSLNTCAHTVQQYVYVCIMKWAWRYIYIYAYLLTRESRDTHLN